MSSEPAQTEILKKRALELAKEFVETQRETDLLEVVEFTLAGEVYGIESIYIKEIYPLQEITPLPGVPAFISGIINVRRKIIPVVNLKKFFQIESENEIKESPIKVIILENESNEFAIESDSIYGVKFIPVNQLQSSLPTLYGIKEEFFKGVTPERVIIFDGLKLLSNNKLIIDQRSEIKGAL